MTGAFKQASFSKPLRHKQNCANRTRAAFCLGGRRHATSTPFPLHHRHPRRCGTSASANRFAVPFPQRANYAHRPPILRPSPQRRLPTPTPNFNVAWPNASLRRRADNYRLRRNLPHRPRTGPVRIIVEKRREGSIRASIRRCSRVSGYQQTQRKAVLGILCRRLQTIERAILQIWARTDAVVFSVIEPV